MKTIKKIFLQVFVIGLIITGLSSCKKTLEWEVDESFDRLFRPSELTASVSGVTATLTWKGKPATNSYVVELSKDSLQFSQIVSTYKTQGVKTANGYSFEIPDLLDPTTRYSARIKGRDTTDVKNESQWTAVTFKTATEQIMLNVTPADVTTTTVVLKWRIPNQVSHFMIGTNRYDISAQEKAAGTKTITGLTPDNGYTAVLYYNNSIRGSQPFRTLSLLPTGPNVVNVGATDDLAALLQNAANGTIFVLLQNSVYSSDNTVVLPANTSITIYGQDGPNKPIVALNGITLGAAHGTIKFENIDLSGYQFGDPTKAKRNYIFNQSLSSNTTEIIFENCIIRNFVNTPMRMQGANPITIDKFTVNKCIVYDIGDNASNGTYAFINTNVATGKINNITITNSTFYKIGYGLILHNLAPTNALIIENNTFNNVVGNARYLIDYNAQNVTTFSFKNNIIGKTLSPTASARGIRYGGTSLVVVNSYKTTDAVISANAIPNIIDYNNASTALFTNPDNGNFTILDNSFIGKSDSGDPRWRK